MIEVHVFNAFLLPELKQSSWFSVLNFINGLVAPSFLFVSGFAFQVSSAGKLDEMRKLGKSFWKKMMRIFQIIIIGYALHLPYYSFSKIVNEATPLQLKDFFAVDVLQCIGVGLLFLFLTRLLIKSDKTYHNFLISSLVFVTLISPLLRKIDFNQYVHPLVGNYFNKINGSLFPVFPWLNFLLAGGIFAKYFVDARERNEEKKFIKSITITGLAVLLFGHLFYSGLFPKTLTSILPNPVFFLERLGYILVLFYLCWIVDRKTNAKNSFVMDASRESLLVYWLHLIIIYGMFWNEKSLAIIISNNLNVPAAIGATFLLIMVMILIAKLWGWAKKKYPKYSSATVRISILALLIIFFVS
jgi:uncharacterized membrane protein